MGVCIIKILKKLTKKIVVCVCVCVCVCVRARACENGCEWLGG